MAGYSGTPLVKKLGIRDGSRVLLVSAPAGFEGELEPLPAGVLLLGASAKDLDVIVFFTDRGAELTRRFAGLAARLEAAGGLWIAWPKKASGVETDLTEDVIRAIGLAHGLVDNKVCAVSEVWSGLRFVIRKENRPKR